MTHHHNILKLVTLILIAATASTHCSDRSSCEYEIESKTDHFMPVASSWSPWSSPLLFDPNAKPAVKQVLIPDLPKISSACQTAINNLKSTYLKKELVLPKAVIERLSRRCHEFIELNQPTANRATPADRCALITTLNQIVFAQEMAKNPNQIELDALRLVIHQIRTF